MQYEKPNFSSVCNETGTLLSKIKYKMVFSIKFPRFLLHFLNADNFWQTCVLCYLKDYSIILILLIVFEYY